MAGIRKYLTAREIEMQKIDDDDWDIFYDEEDWDNEFSDLPSVEKIRRQGSGRMKDELRKVHGR